MCHPVLPPRCAVIAQAALAHQIGQHGSVEVFPSVEVALVSPLGPVAVRCAACCWPQLWGCRGLQRGFRSEQVHFMWEIVVLTWISWDQKSRTVNKKACQRCYSVQRPFHGRCQVVVVLVLDFLLWALIVLLVPLHVITPQISENRWSWGKSRGFSFQRIAIESYCRKKKN